nr:MAG TPA: hypothetical protein [Caudoviricetes sp.]
MLMPRPKRGATPFFHTSIILQNSQKVNIT